MIRVEDDWKLGFSPDGLVGDDGLIEIKTRRQKTQLTTILADEVPRENMAQIQAGLLVTGREWLDYISFCGGMPLYPKRVYPDPRWQAAIIAACRQFEATAIEWAATYRDRVKDLPMTERIDTDLELVV
jgi:predicted phage-related endonuclease